MSEKRRARRKVEPPESSVLPITEIPLNILPTRGIGYPSGTKISYRTLTFGEVKKASTSSKNIVESMKLTISCLSVEKTDAYSLSVMDMFFIGLLVKSSSLGGEKFELPFMCPHCGETGRKIMTQNDISFKELDKRIEELPIEAEIKGRRLKFGPMTVKQFIDLHSGKYNELLREQKPDAVSAYAMLNKSMSFKEAYDFLYDLTDSYDAETMDDIDKVLMHNLDAVKTKCEKCETDIYIKMEGKESLLRPFRKRGEPDRPRIFFQSTPTHITNAPVQDGISNSDTIAE